MYVAGIHLHVKLMLNQSIWGVKKERGQEEPVTKSSDTKCMRLRSLYLAKYLLLTFTSKAHNSLQGVFPIMIGFVTLSHLSFRGSCKKA